MTDFPLIFVFIIQNVRISALNFAVRAHKYLVLINNTIKPKSLKPRLLFPCGPLRSPGAIAPGNFREI